MNQTPAPRGHPEPADPAPLFAVRDLRVEFRGERGARTQALRGVSFTVPAQTTVALVGESGSGKSVGALAALGLLPPNARVQGSVRFHGQELIGASPAALRALRGARIAMVFQEPMSSLNPVMRVGEQIAEVLRLHRRLGAGAAHQAAVRLLEEVGIPQPGLLARAHPHQLSGGQQQRVMIAMAIACEPDLLIADEPTTALDVTIQAQILALLRRLQRERRMAMLFITHDLGVVAELADRVVVMRAGEVLEQGPVAAVLAQPAHPYTRALLACRPPLDARPHRLPVIDWEPPPRVAAPSPEAAPFHDAAPSPEAAPRPTALQPSGTPSPSGAPAGSPPAGAADPHPVLIEVRGLCKTYRLREGWLRHRAVPAVRDVSFSLRRGRTLGLVGESGSGKTTVGLALLRLLPADAGAVLSGGQDLLGLDREAWFAWRRRLQIVFQNPYASLNPRFTVAQTLVEPMRLHGIGADAAERLHLAGELLRRVGLPGAALARYPHEFSGGQRQRIAIARALSTRPEVVVCDESVSALDVSVQAQVLNLLRDLQDEFGLAYLFISHDLAVVKYLADEVLVMKAGEVVEAGDAQALYEQPRHEYTRRLLAAIPRPPGPARSAPT
ncbi:MAG: dipeptide ABC transporter ATP-binding protein [Betaproteobacteria bacterium]|nr:dipeptide ABC transporter ATP-binding protein [Betaproteobacteria bacterium]